jgi:phosphatidyl-myo-inositol dimannoside synthase
MKLLALVSDAFGGEGGIAQYNRDLLSALSTPRERAHILVIPRHGRANYKELPYGLRQLAPLGKCRFTLRTFWAALVEGPFDRVFCGHLHLAPLAAVMAGLLRRPLWLQLHGIESWSHLSRAQQWAAQRAILITAVSRYTRRRFLALSRVDPARVRVLPNTVDARFIPGPKPHSLLDRHGLRSKRILLTVGRLAAAERGKGHDRVLQVFPELLKTHPDLGYLVVGDGDDRERLKALAREIGVEDHVVFAGHVRPDELPDYYRVADVFIMPSTQEGFGIAFVEAAASGLTVIGGDSDGSVDALGDGAIGQVIDPLSAGQLVQAVRTALAEPRNDPEQVRRFRFENFAEHLRGLIWAHFDRPCVTGGDGDARIG